MKIYLEDYGFKRLSNEYYGQRQAYVKQYNFFKLFVYESKDIVHAHIDLVETEIDLPNVDMAWILEFDQTNMELAS